MKLRLLIAAFLTLATSALADASSTIAYCNTQLPIQTNRQISAQNLRNCVAALANDPAAIPANISATNVSVSGSLIGKADLLYISPTDAVTGLTLGQINYDNYRDVRQDGVICDGAPHAQNLPAAQRSLNLAAVRKGITVNLAPRGTTCVYGTDTTLNTESPLYYLSDTNVLFEGTAKHNINNGALFLLQGFYDSISATPSQRVSNVAIIGAAGNMIDTVSRTTTQSRKYIGVTNVDNFLVDGIYVSGTTSNRSFGVQTRNVRNGIIRNSYFGVFPVFPAASGGDAFHIHGDAENVLVINNRMFGDDDGCSLTQEGSTMQNRIQNGVRFESNYCSTYRNSAFKMYVDNSAKNSFITNTKWDNNIFTVHGPAGEDGNCGKIERNGSGTGGVINGVDLANNTYLCKNGDANTGAGAGPALSITSAAGADGYLDNINFSNETFDGYNYRMVELGRNVRNVTFDGGQVRNYTGEQLIVTTSLVTSMTYNTANVMRIDFDPAVSFTGVLANADYYVNVTAGANASNTALFYVTQVSNGFVLATANNISSTTNQTAASISASIVARTGTVFYHRGAQNVTVKNMEFIDPPRMTQMAAESGINPTNAVYENNIVRNFRGLVAFQVTAGMNSVFKNNACVENYGNFCMTESNSAAVSGSIFVQNRDTGLLSNARQSFSFGDPDFMEKWGNIGTNSDKYDFYQFNKISTSTVLGVSGTIGNISTTRATVGTSLTIPSAAGTGNQPACFDANGSFYRATAGAC